MNIVSRIKTRLYKLQHVWGDDKVHNWSNITYAINSFANQISTNVSLLYYLPVTICAQILDCVGSIYGHISLWATYAEKGTPRGELDHVWILAAADILS